MEFEGKCFQGVLEEKMKQTEENRLSDHDMGLAGRPVALSFTINKVQEHQRTIRNVEQFNSNLPFAHSRS